MGTEWAQKRVTLSARKRGCHVVTREIYEQIPELQEFEMGLANLWSADPRASQPQLTIRLACCLFCALSAAARRY